MTHQPKWPEGPTRDNLVPRLRDAEQTGREVLVEWDHDPFLFGEAASEIERLRKGIQDFLDGDYEPKVKKIEKCPHGQYGYESCEACIEQHFLRVISGKQANED